jgi:hypothetical protein
MGRNGHRGGQRLSVNYSKLLIHLLYNQSPDFHRPDNWSVIVSATQLYRHVRCSKKRTMEMFDRLKESGYIQAYDLAFNHYFQIILSIPTAFLDAASRNPLELPQFDVEEDGEGHEGQEGALGAGEDDEGDTDAEEQSK